MRDIAICVALQVVYQQANEAIVEGDEPEYSRVEFFWSTYDYYVNEDIRLVDPELRPFFLMMKNSILDHANVAPINDEPFIEGSVVH